MKLKKTLKHVFSFLLVLCMMCGLVGNYVPSGTVKAEVTAPSYTVTLNGRADGTRFCMYNKKASDGPITLSYTVDEFVGDIGYNGVLSWSGASQYNTYPEMYGSIYKSQTITGGYLNPFMKTGCTYTLTFGLDAEGKLTFSGSYVNQEGETIELTPVTTWARTESPDGTASGGDYGAYKHFGLFFGNSCTGTLTNVTCVDAEENDLGITSNQTGANAIGVQKEVEQEAEKLMPTSYTVTTTGTKEHFFLGNKISATGTVTLTYTVKEIASEAIGNNGVVATHSPEAETPFSDGSMLFNVANMLMVKGSTYTLELFLNSETNFIQFRAWKDGSQLYDLTRQPETTQKTGGEYFGIYFASAVKATLTNVTCVGEDGTDLGLQSNQSDCVILGKVNPTSYKVDLKGKASDRRFCMYNEKASDGPITLSYTVDEFVGDIGYNGVLSWSGASQYITYPETYGSIYKSQTITEGGYLNPFMKTGCTYTLTFGLDANGKLTFSGSYVNQEGETIELTPVTSWARTASPDGTASGGDFGVYKHFGLFFGSCTGTLINVTCVDTTGNDLGITSNQTGAYAIGVTEEKDAMVQEFTASQFASYRTDETSYLTAPEGYVFAGWYSNKACTTALKANTIESTATAYAKYVDADVLSVKYQLPANVSSGDDTTTLRLVTTVDSLQYSFVGFQIYIGDEFIGAYKTKDVYDKITGTTGSTTVTYKPYVFSSESEYFMAVEITGVPSRVFNQTITVIPAWETLDGTVVMAMGNARQDIVIANAIATLEQ